MPSLYVIRGRDQGKLFLVDQPVMRIGRDATNPIQLLDSEVSRSHAELRLGTTGRVELLDLASSNGTLLNGERIERRILRSGDRIQIGQSLMIFTGTATPDSMHAAHSVDIVQQSQEPDASRIVSSWPPALPSAAPIPAPASPSNDNLRSLDVMYQTALAVGRTMEIPDLLDRILRLVFDWVEADRGCIMLRDNESNELQPAARCDRNPARQDRMAISRTILDFVMNQREGVRTTDARDDLRWDAANSIVQLGIREALCVPLLGRYDCVGAIYVDTYTAPGKLMQRPDASRFTDDQLRIMTAIGHQAALAIEDTFYYSSLLQNERLAAIGQTIAILSHHMKNILQGMRGGSYLVGAGLKRGDNDAIERGWQIVEKNQERISNLVLDMLSYSKDREPERVMSNLNDLLNDITELMHVRAAEQNCLLECLPADDLPDCPFDPEAMHRAILNLVTNALDAVADVQNARVTLRSAFEEHSGWTIEVADNGPGIDPEDREKVFSLFESRKGARGTGLGLPVSQKIAQEHGGLIELVHHEGPGCVFRLNLPYETTVNYQPSPQSPDDDPLSALDTLA